MEQIKTHLVANLRKILDAPQTTELQYTGFMPRDEEKAKSAWKGNEDLYEEFCQNVIDFTNSDGWQKWLEFHRRGFWPYSFTNSVLALVQRPDAIMLNSAKRWETLGREVKADAKPIKIWVPFKKKIEKPDPEHPDDVIVESKVTGFFLANVFDVSDTVGEELPVVAHPLQGAAPDNMLQGLLRVADDLGFKVITATKAHLGSANGDCSHQQKTIRLRDDLEPAMRVKTLSHELAHASMHAGVSGYRADRELCEQEAESVAYLVCASMDLSTEAYSLGYVAHWMTGGERLSDEVILKRMKAQGDRVVGTARNLISGLEAYIKSAAHQALSEESPAVML